MRAWWLRLIYKERLTRKCFESEPKLFYPISLAVAGQKEMQQYLYIGHGLLLPTKKAKKKMHFMTISL